jgi:DNA primase
VISQSTITQVRERADILQVIGEAVPSLKRHGRSFTGLCPFHKEKTPSFHVSPDRGFFHCFGCKESGSVIDFVMKHEGATFPEAVRSLAERFNIQVEEDNAPGAAEAERARRQKDELYAAMSVAATFYERQLRDHEHKDHALAELARRGLAFGKDATMDEALTAFRMGYAPAGWDGLAVYLRQQGVSPIAAETVGLLVPRSAGAGHYDRFRHRLMFAVTDMQGRVVAFSGRALAPLPGDARDPGDKPAKYINSPESPIYTKGALLFGLFQARHAIRQEEEAIVVEGNFDVVSLHARGIANVVAPLGTAFTHEQAKLLKRFSSRVVLLFDGDAAGQKAVKASRAPARDAGLVTKVASLPEGTDPDELVRKKGTQALGDVLSTAKGMLEYLIDAELDQGFSAADAREKLARVQEVLRLVAEEADPMEQMLQKSRADQIVSRLDLHGLRFSRDDESHPPTIAALERAVRAAVARERPPPGPAPERARVRTRSPGSEERKAIVEALIEWPVLLDDPEIHEVLGMLEGASVSFVSALRRARISPEDAGGSPDGRGGQIDTEVFLGALPETLRIYAKERLVAGRFFEPGEAKVYLLENANKLKRLLLSREVSELARENEVGASDWEKVLERAEEASARARARHGVKGPKT